jgi:hypothetical protein
MKYFHAALGANLLTLIASNGLAQSGVTNAPWSYVLLEGSSLVEDCPICGRPTILQPMRGTFELVQTHADPLVVRYQIQNVSWFAGSDSTRPYRVSGEGTYRVGGEVAVTQEAQLQVDINNVTARFTNEFTAPVRAWPMIDLTLMQANGTFTQTYTLRVLAAPVREIWFSTGSGFTSGNRTNTATSISSGDLLSVSGRVVKSNSELLARLGLMPGFRPDYGLDGFVPAPGGEIYFSLNQWVFSETLGALDEGDLLSHRGRIVNKNGELLAAFETSQNAGDLGLDAICLRDDGEVWFSVRTNFVSSRAGAVAKGDIISNKGQVVKTNQQLMARFHPPLAENDYGLDALFVWPSGEIWFSTEDGFQDQELGAVLDGDLLSDQGGIVFRNLELVSSFAPIEDAASFGLDGLFVITDSAVRGDRGMVRISRTADPTVSLEWESNRRVFQVERTEAVTGQFLPISPIIPDTTFTETNGVLGKARSFYRVREW